MSKLGLTLLCCLMLTGAGCSLLHHGKSPQQQFVEALDRGNGIKATNIWLHMSAEQRLDLQHGIGITPSPASKQEIQQKIRRHLEDEAQGGDNGESGQQVEGTEQSITVPNVPDGGGLRELPMFAEPSRKKGD